MKEIPMKFSKPVRPVSLVALIEARQKELGVSEFELAEALGFERQIVFTQIQLGRMRFPLEKLPALAKFLDIDAVELLRVALPEQLPGLLEVVEEIYNPHQLTTAETNLIHHLRKLSGDRVGAPIIFEGRGVIALVAV